MHAGGDSRITHIANDLSLRYGLANTDHIMGHMQIRAGKSVHVVNGNVVSAGAAVACPGNLTGPGSVNGSAFGARQIHALMERGRACGGGITVSVGTCQLNIAAGHTPALHRGSCILGRLCGLCSLCGFRGFCCFAGRFLCGILP